MEMADVVRDWVVESSKLVGAESRDDVICADDSTVVLCVSLGRIWVCVVDNDVSLIVEDGSVVGTCALDVDKLCCVDRSELPSDSVSVMNDEDWLWIALESTEVSTESDAVVNSVVLTVPLEDTEGVRDSLDTTVLNSDDVIDAGPEDVGEVCALVDVIEDISVVRTESDCDELSAVDIWTVSDVEDITTVLDTAVYAEEPDCDKLGSADVSTELVSDENKEVLT